MTSPSVARRARGRPPKIESLAEEARVQALSLEAELSVHDSWEIEALAMARRIVAMGRTREALQLLDRLIERDRWENARHREIADVWRRAPEAEEASA